MLQFSLFRSLKTWLLGSQPHAPALLFSLPYQDIFAPLLTKCSYPAPYKVSTLAQDNWAVSQFN